MTQLQLCNVTFLKKQHNENLILHDNKEVVVSHIKTLLLLNNS